MPRKRFVTLLLLTVSLCFAEGNRLVGQKATDWQLPDSDGSMFSLNDWNGKVLQINYVDPDASELNEPFNDAVKQAVDTDKRILREHFQGIGIVDTKATWKPDFLIRSLARSKAEKFKTTILFDYNADLRAKWGLKKDSYSIIILDKRRIVRAVYTDRMNDTQIKEAIDLIALLQNEPYSPDIDKHEPRQPN